MLKSPPLTQDEQDIIDLRWVMHIADGIFYKLPKHVRSSFLGDELYGEAIEAFCKAKLSYDSTKARGQSFQTYAAIKIKQATTDFMRKENLLTRGQQTIVNELKANPDLSNNEISEKINNLTTSKKGINWASRVHLQNAMTGNMHVNSLDDHNSIAGQKANSLADATTQTASEALRNLELEKLGQAILILPPHQQAIVRGVLSGKKYHEIGKDLGLSVHMINYEFGNIKKSIRKYMEYQAPMEKVAKQNKIRQTTIFEDSKTIETTKDTSANPFFSAKDNSNNAEELLPSKVYREKIAVPNGARRGIC